jgi:hypothetical protein
MVHQSLGISPELRWEVDPQAIGRVFAWSRRQPAILTADLESMATYFPSWVLVGALAGKISTCPDCQLPCVPIASAIRCPGCHAEYPADQLIWIGSLPTLMRPEPAFTIRRTALQAAGFAETSAAGQEYMLVPLTLRYPTEWPNVEPTVCYAPRWLDAAGLPRASAAHHLIRGGQACLFAWGQWQAQPIANVLQQRVVNHVASLIKIIAGQAPADAFIGRIHTDNWRPER